MPGTCRGAYSARNLILMNAMTEEVENLLLEHMKRFHAGQDRIERRLEEIVGRAGRLETSMVDLRRDHLHTEEFCAALSVRLDHVDGRLARIEKRLELAS